MISRTAASMGGVQTPAWAAVTREQLASCDKLDLRFAAATGTKLRKPEEHLQQAERCAISAGAPGLVASQPDAVIV